MIRLTGPEPENSAESLRRLLELQSDFAARLSEETLRYLRNLQGVIGPATPGTVVLAERETALDTEGRPGGTVVLAVEVLNEQAVYGVVAPALSPLVSGQGGTWFPQASVDPPYQLVEPHATRRIAVTIAVPVDIPPETYRGMILFPGSPNGVGVAVRVSSLTPPPPVPDEQATAQTGTGAPAARRRRAEPAGASPTEPVPPRTEDPT
ncbi:hypothetical protein JOD57_003875 [Geodermatophilus bullaregiensis]|uniref:hypothetical protein n=1 Tax=Geodermatophilus bullaregiensis TaxID=1564160 RepID=UPI001958FCF7|nr:hypothetical protein [Geodermatophilus bullaregiensis]MBM7808038.1 hypothetical protein [Geodermatophilus bullaregiensis]